MTLAPGRIWPGSPIRLTISYTNDDGDLVDPAVVSIKVMSPCGVTATYTFGTNSEVGKQATGVYFADITPNEGGLWHFRWETTGTNTISADEGNFLVQFSPFVDAYHGDYT